MNSGADGRVVSAAGFFAFLLPGGHFHRDVRDLRSLVPKLFELCRERRILFAQNNGDFGQRPAIFDAEFSNGATSGTTLEGVHARTQFS